MASIHHQPPKQPTLFVFPDKQALTQSLADFIAKAQKESIDRKGRFTIALSGGSLPAALTGLIGNPSIKWNHWQVFYADERLVPLDHADSNHLACTKALFEHVPIPAENIHTIDPALINDRESLADEYEKVLIREFAQKDAARFPVFDLILLGVGPDGHTASLFPGHALLSEEDRWVADIADSPKPPSVRITLTYPVLNHAARVAFVAAGGVGKADIVQAILDRPEEGLPAARVRPSFPGQLVWFVDEGAASTTKYQRTAFKL